MRVQIAHRVPFRVFGTAASGNCHKVRLALDLLGLPYRWHEVDVLAGESRTDTFLAINPVGQVPVLQIDDHT
ncbi:MAG: glutathione S-transferase N-terminal domain-containing protein, partial [Betaproteobacteria bacterium]